MFQKVDRANLAPSRCMLCQANDGPMIDTGLRGRLPVGAVYICVNRCLPNLLRALDALTPTESEAALRELNELRETNAELIVELGSLRRLERAVAAAREQVPA